MALISINSAPQQSGLQDFQDNKIEKRHLEARLRYLLDMLSQILYGKTQDVGKLYGLLICLE